MVWRAVLIVLGLVSYSFTTRMFVRAVAEFAGGSNLQRAIIIPYLAAGVAACLVAAFYRDSSGAIAGAAREAFLANIVMLAAPRLITRRSIAAERGFVYVTRSPGWLAASAIVFLGFAVVMGRGLRPG
jgi:hypothetical protein